MCQYMNTGSGIFKLYSRNSLRHGVLLKKCSSVLNIVLFKPKQACAAEMAVRYAALCACVIVIRQVARRDAR